MDAAICIPLTFVRAPFTPAESKVMVTLASLLPDSGPKVIECWQIARDANVSEGTVFKAVRVLEERGYLRIVRRPAEGNTYSLGPAWTGAKAGAPR